MGEHDQADALIGQYRDWQAEGRCYACGAPATHVVNLTWMKPERLYCSTHAREWAQAGWPNFVHPRVAADQPSPPETWIVHDETQVHGSEEELAARLDDVRAEQAMRALRAETEADMWRNVAHSLALRLRILGETSPALTDYYNLVNSSRSRQRRHMPFDRWRFQGRQ